MKIDKLTRERKLKALEEALATGREADMEKALLALMQMYSNELADAMLNGISDAELPLIVAALELASKSIRCAMPADGAEIADGLVELLAESAACVKLPFGWPGKEGRGNG